MRTCVAPLLRRLPIQLLQRLLLLLPAGCVHQDHCLCHVQVLQHIAAAAQLAWLAWLLLLLLPVLHQARGCTAPASAAVLHLQLKA